MDFDFVEVPGTRRPSSTGGVIEYTQTGLVHRAGRAYGGSATVDEDEDVAEVPVSRKRNG